jgi:hypothetical protein
VAEISKLGAKTDVKGAWRFTERRQWTAVAEISKLGAGTDVKGAWRFPERRQLSVCPSRSWNPKSAPRLTDGQTSELIKRISFHYLGDYLMTELTLG